MLEREFIQARGFHNISVGEKVVGFQVRVKSDYYRGVWLSMLRMGTLEIDGEVIEDITFSFDDGKNYFTREQMLYEGDKQWPIETPCIIRANYPGGLSQGWHEVTFDYRYIMSYMPPSMNSDEAFARLPRKIKQRKLIIV